MADLRVVVNGREHVLDFADLMIRLRVHFARQSPVWAAVTQGDPTDINIGWSPAGGPVWFDYDTAGLNALPPASLAEPVVHVQHSGSSLVIDYRHAPSPARRHVLHRYLDEVVHPIARYLGIDDLMAWLRPYLVMRLLAVYHLAELNPRDIALSLALLAQVLDPATTLPDFLAVTPSRTEV